MVGVLNNSTTTGKGSDTLKKTINHFKKYVIRGLLAIIPLALTFFVIQLLYVGVDKKVMGFIQRFIGVNIPGLGFVIVLLILYLIGLIASNIAGRQLFTWVEKLFQKIPLINTTYQVGKQLSDTLALPEKHVFRKAVLVDYLKPGIWTVGFVTGSIIDRKNNNTKLLKVFVPTPPNPTSGTMVIVRESEVRDPGWTVEEAIRTVISGGIIGPTTIT
ncbi:MAG: DUF502 domain-containing protein [bacterium]|nr:DUF502 domain-containing protein [bacterium]